MGARNKYNLKTVVIKIIRFNIWKFVADIDLDSRLIAMNCTRHSSEESQPTNLYKIWIEYIELETKLGSWEIDGLSDRNRREKIKMKIKKAVLLLGILCCSVVLISCTKENEENNSTQQEEKGTITEVVTNEENERNPIDSYFQPLLKRDMPEASRRELETLYGKAWKEEYKNVLDWLLGKCNYEEDKENIRKLNERVEEYIKLMEPVLKTEILDAYDSKPNADKPIEGNGTNSSLIYLQGKMYRDISILLIQSWDSDKEQYEFLRDDYSEFSAE